MLDLISPDSSILLLRAATGAFFGISGFNKLFNRGRHESLRANLVKNKIPFIRVNEWFVPGVEFVAGSFLVLGLLTQVSALMLATICLVATCCEGPGKVKTWHCINKADKLDTWLYLPEIIYGIVLLSLILGGGGRFSLDKVFQ